MLRALLLLSSAIVSSWLIYTFGVGMLVATGALGAASLLFSLGRPHQADRARRNRLAGYRTTRRAPF